MQVIEIRTKQRMRKYEYLSFQSRTFASKLYILVHIIPRQSAEVDEKFKASFICSLSHELFSPLNAILPLIRLMPNMRSGGVNLKNLFYSNAEILHSKIQDLIDYTKIEMRELKHELKAFNVGELLDELREIYKYEAKAKGNGLRFEKHTKEKMIIVGDRKRVRQVLIKLISNAIK